MATRTSILARRGPALVALVVVLILATTVRFWRLGWGLDQRMAFPDERIFWTSYLFAFVPFEWKSLFGHSLFYPPLYGYLVAAAVAAGHGLGLIAPGDVDHGLLIARGVSAVAGVVTVVLVGAIGWRFYGQRIGFLAAALMAALPFEAIQTHYASVDVTLGTTTALILLATSAFTLDRRPLLAAASGACVALASCTKYNGIVFLAVPGWVLLEVAVRERAPRRALLLGLALAAGFLVALAIALPPLYVEPGRVVAGLRKVIGQSRGGGWGFGNNHLVPSLGWYGRPYLYQLFASLPFTLGWPLYLASLLGLAVALRRRTAVDRVLLIAFAVYFFLLGRTLVSFPRYLIPLFPGLVVLASRALLELPFGGRRARVAVCAAVLAYSFALGFSHVERFSYRQQFGVARWLRERFRLARYPHLVVAIPGDIAPYYALRPPLSQVLISPLHARAGSWLERRPDVFVLPEWRAINIRRDRHDEAALRDLAALESGAAGYHEAARWHSHYLQDGFYGWLDPGFAGDLYIGEIGFRIYLRDDHLEPSESASSRR